MLSELYIENLAVIEKTTVRFSQGLTVLSGETGAGKSILIDAINLVLGQRFQPGFGAYRGGKGFGLRCVRSHFRCCRTAVGAVRL